METIEIENNTLKELNKRKKRGDSMDNVLSRMLLEFPEEKK